MISVGRNTESEAENSQTFVQYTRIHGHVNLVKAIEKSRKKAMVGSYVLNTINMSAFPVCPFQPRQKKKPLEATCITARWAILLPNIVYKRRRPVAHSINLQCFVFDVNRFYLHVVFVIVLLWTALLPDFAFEKPIYNSIAYLAVSVS